MKSTGCETPVQALGTFKKQFQDNLRLLSERPMGWMGNPEISNPEYCSYYTCKVLVFLLISGIDLDLMSFLPMTINKTHCDDCPK